MFFGMFCKMLFLGKNSALVFKPGSSENLIDTSSISGTTSKASSQKTYPSGNTRNPIIRDKLGRILKLATARGSGIDQLMSQAGSVYCLSGELGC